MISNYFLFGSTKVTGNNLMAYFMFIIEFFILNVTLLIIILPSYFALIFNIVIFNIIIL